MKAVATLKGFAVVALAVALEAGFLLQVAIPSRAVIAASHRASRPSLVAEAVPSSLAPAFAVARAVPADRS